MKPKRWLAVAALCGVVGLTTGCPDQEVRDYLGEAGGDTGLRHWEDRVQKAICQLEQKDPAGLDPMLRICPSGPPSLTPPPKYPPS